LRGAVERNGEMRARIAPNSKAKTLGHFLMETVDFKETILMTDESNRYNNVAKSIERYSVNHSKGEYARYGVIHVNTIEGFWSHVKRSVKGTHKVVSKKYLQSYLDGFVFHYNNRHNDNERFVSLLGTLMTASK